MASTILTAVKVWENFEVEKDINEEIINEFTANGITIKNFYFDGRKVGKDRVKIFATLVRSSTTEIEKSSAIILTQKYVDGNNTNLAEVLAKKGYVVLIINQGGKTEGEKYGTVYPDSIGYAYYDVDRVSKTEIENTVRETCFFEWSVNEIYAFHYLRDKLNVKNIGALAIDEFANALWQSATIVPLSCAVIIGDAGWKGYKGVSKFFTEKEKEFTDNEIKYLAGVDSQSYAMHVKCPILLLCPTNSPEYDLDRAYDSVSVIKQDVYFAIDYSIGSRNEITYKTYENVYLFFDKFLKCEDIVLPKPISMKVDLVDGKILIEVSPDVNNLKELTIFCTEDTGKSALRSWQMIKEVKALSNEKFIFEYKPYKNSNASIFFATAVYKNNFRICSNLFCKKYEKEEIDGNYRHRILYSSRYDDCLKYFSPLLENSDKPTGIDIRANSGVVEEKKGPFNIQGITAKGGLVTFMIGAEKFKPKADEMLLLDVYIKDGGDFEVVMVEDVFGDKKEYSCKIKVTAEMWQNVKISMLDFKQENGKSLKNYEKVEAIKFFSEKDFLINNVLWV